MLLCIKTLNSPPSCLQLCIHTPEASFLVSCPMYLMYPFLSSSIPYFHLSWSSLQFESPYPCIHIHTYISTYVHPSINSSIFLSIHPSSHPSIHPSMHTHIHAYTYTCTHTHLQLRFRCLREHVFDFLSQVTLLNEFQTLAFPCTFHLSLQMNKIPHMCVCVHVPSHTPHFHYLFFC